MTRILLILLVIFSSRLIAAEEPAVINLTVAAEVENIGFSRSPTLLKDNIFAREGANWNSNKALAAISDSAQIILDLHATYPITNLILQADGNDTYIVDFSLDKNLWRPVWHASADGSGLRRRSVEFLSAESAHYIRIRAGANDGAISISEFQVFSNRPNNWQDLITPPTGPKSFQWTSWLGISTIEKIKSVVLLLALLLLSINLTLAAVNRNDYLNSLRKYCLGALALLSLALWCNLFQFHFSKNIHQHEFYHYYLGSKYSPELGYTRLYRCTIAADRETRIPLYVNNRKIRDLEDNRVVDSASIDSEQSCKNYFSALRWQEFSKDLEWFRNSTNFKTYSKMQLDHGYNATPVWNILGYWIANLTIASDASLFTLSLLDPLLLLVVAVYCYYVFGFEAFCVASIFFGCNFIASYSWTGGAFLRFDWLFWSLLGFGFLKQNKPKRACASLTYAGFLRVFPLAFLGFLFLYPFIQAVSKRKKFSLNALIPRITTTLLCSIILVSLSLIPTKSFKIWDQFFANTHKHFNTRSTNMMGLEPILVSSDENSTHVLFDPFLPDPYSLWKSTLDIRDTALKPTFLLIAILFLGAVSVRCAKLQEWQVAILGISLLPFINLSNYDYCFLVILAFLGARAQLMLLIVGYLSWCGPQLFRDLDQTYLFCSILCTLAIGFSPWLTRSDGDLINSDK